MVELTRTVRFCINDGAVSDSPPYNTFAAYPSMRGLGRYYELEVHCRGQIDPPSGYFINIKEIDRAVRSVAVPLIVRACAQSSSTDPAAILPGVVDSINAALNGRVARVRWKLTPYYSIEMTNDSAHANPPTALLRQQFEFAASHRLHAPHLSEEANRALYGKCNNPRGHGHNYRVEPCVEVRTNSGFGLGDLERITAEQIVDRFDHKHLNEDTQEFDQRAPDGLSPSVENIARVCFHLLSPALASHPSGATLRSVTVWETDKTSCTYPG